MRLIPKLSVEQFAVHLGTVGSLLFEGSAMRQLFIGVLVLGLAGCDSKITENNSAPAKSNTDAEPTTSDSDQATDQMESQDSKPAVTKPVPTVVQKTVPGSGEMEGWAVYKPVILIERERAQELVSGNESIEGSIIQFFASLMRGDKSFEAMLSPRMEAAVRERFVTEMPAAVKDLNRVSVHGHVPFEQAIKHRQMERMATGGRKIFGDFDSLVFCEGNSARDDIPMLLVKHEGKWYVAGILARQFEALLPPEFRQ